MKNACRSFFATVCLLSSAAALQASPVTYDMSWTGVGGYSMTGYFSFDTSAGSEVRDSEVTALNFTALLNGAPIGVWDLTDPAVGTFNFNFDATNGTFFVGGASSGDNGQNWNSIAGLDCASGTVGFSSGLGAQALCVSGSLAGAIAVSTPTLVASLRQTNDVPEPGSLALLGLGLAGLAVVRKRKQA